MFLVADSLETLQLHMQESSNLHPPGRIYGQHSCLSLMMDALIAEKGLETLHLYQEESLKLAESIGGEAR